jgi:hypothetical protein
MSTQAAGRAVNAATKAASKSAGDHVLNKGAKRDPELYVCTQLLQKLQISSNCIFGSSSMSNYVYGAMLISIDAQVLLAVMSGAFGLAGFYFGKSSLPSTNHLVCFQLTRSSL